MADRLRRQKIIISRFVNSTQMMVIFTYPSSLPCCWTVWKLPMATSAIVRVESKCVSGWRSGGSFCLGHPCWANRVMESMLVII